jgi:hypothetical protein
MILASGLLSGACRSKNMETESTTEVLKQAAEDKYDPPADKKISDKQMQIYMAVRKREVEIARNAASRLEAKSEELKAKKEKAGLMDTLNALSDVGKFLTADIRAAKELGYNTAEYQWVKGQVLEASLNAMTEGFQQAATKTVEQSRRYYEEQLAKAKTPEEKQMWQQSLDALKKQQGEMEKNSEVPEYVRHNREIIKKVQGELDAIKVEMEKYNAGKEATKK